MRLMPTYSFADSFVQFFMQIGHQHLLCGSHSGRCGGLFMGEDSVFSFFFFFVVFGTWVSLAGHLILFLHPVENTGSGSPLSFG